MEYNLIENIEYCAAYVADIENVLLYSHVAPAIIVFILGVFIFIKSRENLLARILLAISTAFTIWVGLNLTIWFNYAHPTLLMAAWSIIEIFSVCLFALSLYFCYVYLEKKNLSPLMGFVLFTPIVPVVLLATSSLYLIGYDPQECIAIEHEPYIAYVRVLKLCYAGGLFGYLLFKLIRKRAALIGKEILVLGVGIISFLYSFLLAGYLSEQTGDYRYELYGLFAVIIFITALGYLIVKYHAFNVKVLGAQALVLSMIALVAAEFLFISSVTNRILVAATLLLVCVSGYFLIGSVKREVQARERNERLAKDLAGANARLRELDRQKSEFVSIASHQLRSPLTAIRGYASMLLEGSYGAVPEKARGILERIQESSGYMATSIEDFLNVSRIEQGRMKYELTTVDISLMTGKVIEELQSFAQKQKVTLVLKPSSAPEASANVDPGKMRQIIYNLIDNALKYTPKGTVEVEVRKNESAKVITIAISDTGVGMSLETQGAIFDKFIRAKNANSVNVSGTGLGLYVAKQMVEAMRGRINATSPGEGKGSTFTITIPMAS